jgi:hypothetical protein
MLTWQSQISALPPQQFDGRMLVLKRMAVDDTLSINNCWFIQDSGVLRMKEGHCADLSCHSLFNDDK